LHSSNLEYLGLEAATASLCTELSERQNIKIDLRCDAIPEDVPREVSLCLFRVLQEALHNAVKYSGVGTFEVTLTGSSREIELKVHDSGVGFDAKAGSNGHGLGLTSMRERLRLVGGQFSIDSQPNQGTTVFARVPLPDQTPTASAAA
jgi:signal transduction histidine kinase